MVTFSGKVYKYTRKKTARERGKLGRRSTQSERLFLAAAAAHALRQYIQ